MDSSFARAVLSFALVASAYWAYLNVAEPLLTGTQAANAYGDNQSVTPDAAIETVPGNRSDPLQSQDSLVRPPKSPPAAAPTDRLLALVAPYFPADSWERTSARVIKNDQFMLLFGESKTTEDGRLHVKPCTIVFRPDGLSGRATQVAANSNDSAAEGRTWVVQSPQGAVLSFDQPLDDRLMNVGRLQTAFVPGEVTIRANESRPGAGDPIELTAQNVQMSEDQIWTPGAVHFRVGPHFGNGRDLKIAMTAVARGEIKRLPTTIPDRVQSVELVHLDKLQISMPEMRESTANDGRSVTRIVNVPVSISCQGFLLMEMARGVAQITKAVRIARPRLDDTGLADHLECDQLAIYFGRNLIFKEDERAAQPPPFDFERVVATGSPALAYSSRQGTGIDQAKYLLESPKLEFALEGRPEFHAEGAGRLLGLMGDELRRAEVHWQGGLAYRENETGGLVTIQQQAKCVVEELGHVDAERLQIRLKRSDSQTVPTDAVTRSPQQALPAKLQPVSIDAEGRVRAELRQIKAQVNSLSVAFQQRANLPQSNQLRLNAPRPLPARMADNNSAATARQFIVTGDTMQLGVLQNGQQVAIDSIAIDRAVRCVEVLGDNAGRGGELTGDRFELNQIASGAAVGSFTGSPVKIRANRLDVRGPVVRFDQGLNRLWIDGAGSAALPLPPQAAKRFAGRAAVGYLSWQQSLSFDGTEVRADGGVDGSVEVRGPSQLIRCSRVLGKLTTPIRFDDVTAGAAINADGIQLEEIVADGDVSIENRAFDARGLIAIDSGNMQRVKINQATSEFVGIGPGQVKTVRLGKPATAPNRQLTGRMQATPVGPAKTQISYLRVRFQRQVNGNLQVRRLSFEDRVQAVYGPVPNWDIEVTEDPRRLQKDQVALRCDRLSVLQMLRRGQREAPFEFQALGNTLLEGEDFQASAHRLSYDQAKDQIVMEGIDGADVRIVRSSNGKRQSTDARKIQFWPKSQRIEVQGADSIELN